MVPRCREAHDASMDTTMTPPEPSPTDPHAGSQSSGPPPPGPTLPRRLTRSRSDRMLAGVAGGVARTYGFDVGLVRIAFVVATVVTAGAAAVAYVVAWLVLPEAEAGEPVVASALRHARRHRFD